MADQMIRGGLELDALLKTLAPKIEKNIMRAALRAGAVVVRTEAKSNVPIDEGPLKKSIRISTKARRGTLTASVKAGGKLAPHALLAEFGTAAHKILPKKALALLVGGAVVGGIDHPGARPKPFMRPSLDAASGAAVQAVADKIRERLTKEGINVPAPESD